MFARRQVHTLSGPLCGFGTRFAKVCAVLARRRAPGSRAVLRTALTSGNPGRSQVATALPSPMIAYQYLTLRHYVLY
jgi:hypothetical protein